MQSIHLKLSISADPKQFDRGAPAGAVIMEAVRGFLGSLPGAVVSSAAWGLTERESDLQELRELKQRVRVMQQQVEDTRELQELRHTVQKLTERLAELEAATAPAEEEIVEEPALEESAPEEPAEQPEETASRQERPRRRVR